MHDKTYIKHIKNSKFLGENTKEIYLSRLEVIKNNIWKNCKSLKNKVGKGKCLHYICLNSLCLKTILLFFLDLALKKLDCYI